MTAKTEAFSERFLASGFAVIPADDKHSLDTLRDRLFSDAKTFVGWSGDDPNVFMNSFHELDLNTVSLNDLRMRLIETFNVCPDTNSLIYRAFEKTLARLVGPDIAVQKSCNIVIQRPNDSDVAPVHRDAPPNSPFEVVVWIPMVDCYGSKGMFMLDREQTRRANKVLQSDPDDTEGYNTFVRNAGQSIEVPFGSACCFWTGLIHVIPINTESETRWSLNTRFKNAFSPYGAKGLPDYFRILDLSPVAKLGVEAEKERYADLPRPKVALS